MTLKVGSAIFNNNGVPGVVKNLDQERKEYTVDTDRDEVRKLHKHGYINGLSMDERAVFNKAVDEVLEIEDPREKIEKMQKMIEDSRLDSKNMRVTRYLESELFHQMQILNVSPRYFKANMPLAAVARSI
jgi:hypothetical protein